MGKRSAGIAGYEGPGHYAAAVVNGTGDWLLKHVGPRGLWHLTFALTLSIIFNLIILVLIPYPSIVYGILVFLWPIVSIFLLTRIYYAHIDKNITHLAGLYSIALMPWAATILLRGAILPFYYDGPLAVYFSGSGFFIGYVLLISGLNKVKRSKQMSLIKPPRDKMISAAGLLMAAVVVLFVLLELDWNGAFIDDVLVLMLFIVGDIVVLTLGLRLIGANLKFRLNYLLLAIVVFIGITALGDLIREMGWLLPPGPVLSLTIEHIADLAYGTALLFSVFAFALFNVDIRDKAVDRISDKLNDTRLFIDDIVMQAPYAIIIFDTAGDLVLVNDTFLRMFRVKRPDIIRQYNLFSNIDVPGVNLGPATARLKQGKTVAISKIEFCLPGGKTLNISAKAFPTFRANGNISNYVTIIEDIGERIRAEKELLDAKTQAELYVDLMGHDLSNIHHIAMGYLELANDKLGSAGALGRESEDLIRTPIDNLKYGTRLIDNVRKLRGEKNGRYPLKSMDIDRVLLEVKREIDSPVHREVTIGYEAGCGRPVMANDLLKDVFINLIGNAIKHSKGRLSVVVRTQVVDEEGARLCKVTIEDDGPGIPDGRKGNIFERMHDDPGVPTGKGLGLYLVKTLIDDYRGRIWVEDRVPGDYTKGARFVILLSIAE